MDQEERLIALETKIAYLENYINEINMVVIEQEKTIKKLEFDSEDLRNQIASGKDALPENEKPPHY